MQPTPLEFPASYCSFITTVSSGGAGPAHGLYEFGSESWLDWQEDLGLRIPLMYRARADG